MDLNTTINKNDFKNNISLNKKIKLKSNTYDIKSNTDIKINQIDNDIIYDGEVILCPNSNFKTQKEFNNFVKNSIEEFEINENILNDFEDLILKYQIAKL